MVPLAEQFGPFLFALLFILFVTRTAHRYYRDCNTRTTPPASREEKSAYRFYFVCSIWAGIAVMALAVAWWVYFQSRGNHVYQVAIIGLKSNEDITADYFFKLVQRPTVVGGAVIRDKYFLFVQDYPFKLGDTFTFSYYKDIPQAIDPNRTGVVAEPFQVEIEFSGKRLDRFKITKVKGQPALAAFVSEPSSSYQVVLSATAPLSRSFFGGGAE